MLGLYIHIPFCVRKCRYCDFLSAPACDSEREAYLKSLHGQIKAIGERLRQKKVRETLYCRQYFYRRRYAVFVII